MAYKKYLTTKRPSDYRKFRISLHIDFDDLKIETKDELSFLMRNKGYHLKGKNFSVKDSPTQPQLNFAWNELKHSYSIDTFFNVERYKRNNTIYRATKTRTVNGKKYRKGQFLPKQKDV